MASTPSCILNASEIFQVKWRIVMLDTLEGWNRLAKSVDRQWTELLGRRVRHVGHDGFRHVGHNPYDCLTWDVSVKTPKDFRIFTPKCGLRCTHTHTHTHPSFIPQDLQKCTKEFLPITQLAYGWKTIVKSSHSSSFQTNQWSIPTQPVSQSHLHWEQNGIIDVCCSCETCHLSYAEKRQTAKGSRGFQKLGRQG